MLAGVFEGREPDITEENLQARIRGNLLMALSNKFGWLVLTTGNKSENSVGYSTLYGDSAGGFAVIKDVPKTLVYRLVDFRNARDERQPVPRSIVDRPPSAELRPDQKDADSLPDYDTLDAILEAYVEEDAGRDQLDARRPAARGGGARLRARRPGGVQAPPGAAGDQDHAARVRPRPAHADHERVPRRLETDECHLMLPHGGIETTLVASPRLPVASTATSRTRSSGARAVAAPRSRSGIERGWLDPAAHRRVRGRARPEDSRVALGGGGARPRRRSGAGPRRGGSPLGDAQGSSDHRGDRADHGRTSEA